MLFGLPSPKVHFDTNAVRNFFRPRILPEGALEVLRRRVVELVAGGRLRVVLGQPVLWELTDLADDPDPQLYERTLGFYASIGHRWFMHHEHARMRAELLRRRPMEDAEAFYQADPAEMVARCLSSEWIAERQRVMHQHKGDERTREAEKRARTVEAFAELAGKRGRAEWRAMVDEDLGDAAWDRAIAGMVRYEMRRVARREGLRIAGHQWPLPKRVPTFWLGEAFLAAKARRVFVESRKQLTSRSSIDDMPDLVDGTHFRDCAYVDVLVTDDFSFREVALAARTSVLVIGQAEFVAGIGMPE